MNKLYMRARLGFSTLDIAEVEQRLNELDGLAIDTEGEVVAALEHLRMARERLERAKALVEQAS